MSVIPTSAMTSSTPATGTQSTSGTAATGGSSNANSQLSLASNFNTFLNLLTTQLKNQDPSNPVDSNQFTQQLVEFAGVQQQVQSNTTLSQILAATQGNQVSSAASYIGTTIQASGNQGGLSGGHATFGYTLASAATNTQVTIKDGLGNTVFTGSGTNNSGSNTVSWDGKNSFTGATEPDGTYSISVTSADAQGRAVAATPYITGQVTSASIANGVVNLSIGSLQVPTTSVTSITNLPGTT